MSSPRRLLDLCAFAAAMLASAAAQDRPQEPIGEIFASDASVKGAVQLAGAGMQVMSGSSIGAGQAVALLRLTRGGDMRVCPRTDLSISSSHNGRDLMFGMSMGAIEAEYSLPASADAILTPDFRILLAGPGTFHVAVGADARGNTCVRPLAGNTASVIVSELMGDGTYQVKPDQQVVFHDGKVANPDRVVGECGCPAPPPVMRATEVPPLPNIAELRKKSPPSLAMPSDATPPPAAPAPAANEVHIQVDAPFVFSANEPEPAPLTLVAQLKVSAAPPWALVPQPPPPPELRPPAPSPPAPAAAQAAAPKRKFFGRIRAFFASIFR
ncbi:MAG: hypothetical protein LAO06_16425 [Acidobacteriia bacterium]|nr:hypothetical protein [Terriglobia bacterium]